MWINNEKVAQESDRYDSEELIAELLLAQAGETAQQRMKEYAQEEKQSVKEIARRTASNLLSSFTDRL